MTRFYSDLTQGISQQRREQIEQRKEQIRRKWFTAPQVDKINTENNVYS